MDLGAVRGAGGGLTWSVPRHIASGAHTEVGDVAIDRRAVGKRAGLEHRQVAGGCVYPTTSVGFSFVASHVVSENCVAGGGTRSDLEGPVKFRRIDLNRRDLVPVEIVD